MEQQLSWKPITEHFGAEINIDLGQDLSDSVKKQIARLFDERYLLVFRNQNLDYEGQRRVAEICGNVLPFEGDAKYISTVHDTHGNLIEQPRYLDVRTEMFHCDNMFLPVQPVHAICLYGEDVALDARSGTHFISLGDRLPDDMRTQLKGRTAIQQHGFRLPVEETMRMRHFPFEAVKDKVDHWSEHPLLIAHPRTGDPLVYYAPVHTHSIVGMSPEESLAWFAKLEAILYEKAGVYTHRWRQGDLVIWDNFALQHAKEHVEESGPPPKRVLRRAVLGPQAYNVFGKTSYGDLAPEEIASIYP